MASLGGGMLGDNAGRVARAVERRALRPPTPAGSLPDPNKIEQLGGAGDWRSNAYIKDVMGSLGTTHRQGTPYEGLGGPPIPVEGVAAQKPLFSPIAPSPEPVASSVPNFGNIIEDSMNRLGGVAGAFMPGGSGMTAGMGGIGNMINNMMRRARTTGRTNFLGREVV